MIYGAVAEHPKVLGIAPGWSGGVRLLPGVGHTDAFDWFLSDAIDHQRGLDASGFEDGRYDVNHVVELRADATHIRDVAGPRHNHALPRTAEEGGYLLGPFERRIESPRPCHGHVRRGHIRAPRIVKLQLVLDRHIDRLNRGKVEWRADCGTFSAGAVYRR